MRPIVSFSLLHRRLSRHLSPSGLPTLLAGVCDISIIIRIMIFRILFILFFYLVVVYLTGFYGACIAN